MPPSSQYPFQIDPSLYQTQQPQNPQQQQMFDHPMISPQPFQQPVATPNITVVVGDKNEVRGSTEQDTPTNAANNIRVDNIGEPEQKEKKDNKEGAKYGIAAKCRSSVSAKMFCGICIFISMKFSYVSIGAGLYLVPYQVG